MTYEPTFWIFYTGMCGNMLLTRSTGAIPGIFFCICSIFAWTWHSFHRMFCIFVPLCNRCLKRPALVLVSFSWLKPTTSCRAGTTYLATIRTASSALVLSATLEPKRRASPKNSRESSLLSPPWRGTSACPSSGTTSCLEVRGLDSHWFPSGFRRLSKRLSSCRFTLINRMMERMECFSLFTVY